MLNYFRGNETRLYCFLYIEMEFDETSYIKYLRVKVHFYKLKNYFTIKRHCLFPFFRTAKFQTAI